MDGESARAHSSHTNSHLLATRFTQYSNFIIELHIEFAAVYAFAFATLLQIVRCIVSNTERQPSTNKSPMRFAMAEKQWKTKVLK